MMGIREWWRGIRERQAAALAESRKRAEEHQRHLNEEAAKAAVYQAGLAALEREERERVAALSRAGGVEPGRVPVTDPRNAGDDTFTVTPLPQLVYGSAMLFRRVDGRIVDSAGLPQYDRAATEERWKADPHAPAVLYWPETRGLRVIFYDNRGQVIQGPDTFGE